MKVKGFGAWPSRNVSSGGQRSSFDVYNRSYKGDPYNFAYKKKNYRDMTGYMDRGVEEYHHVPEMKDMTTDDDQKEKATAAGAALASQKSRQVVLRQVVALLVGSVVIVAGYQASLKERSQPPIEPPAAVADNAAAPDSAVNPSQSPEEQPSENPTQPTESPTQPATTAAGQSGSSSSGSGTSSGTTASWSWNEDGTVTLIMTDSAGNVIGEVAATVTTSEIPADCTTEGTVTRTASAQYDGQTYTDARSETSPALGHSFDDGTEVTLSDGRTAMEFECARCHEHFTIVNSIDEE